MVTFYMFSIVLGGVKLGGTYAWFHFNLFLNSTRSYIWQGHMCGSNKMRNEREPFLNHRIQCPRGRPPASAGRRGR